MTREDLEIKLRELAAQPQAGPTDPALRAMADRIWNELRAPRPAGRRLRVWLVPVVAALATAALLLWPGGRQPAPIPEPLSLSEADLDAAAAGALLSDLESEMNEDLREFEETLVEPSSAGEMLLEMDETELRDLVAALQKETRG